MPNRKKEKTMLRTKAAKNHKKQQVRSHSLHFVILYGLVAALTIALAITLFFVYHLWQERDRTSVYTLASMVADAIDGLSYPVAQIGTDTQVLPTMRLTMPYAGQGLLQHRSYDASAVPLTVDWLAWKGSLYGAASSEALFAALPTAQKCTIAYVVTDASTKYEWRDDVTFTEISRHTVADGRTIAVLKNTEAVCEDVFHFNRTSDEYTKIEAALAATQSY